MTKREHMDQAKALLKENKSVEASTIFNSVIEDFNAELDGWDAFYMVKCVRTGGDIPKVDEIAGRFNDPEPLNGIYAWLLYDRHVKAFDKREIENHELGIRQLIERVQQKDFNVPDADNIPCPYTMGVFALIKAYRKPNFNGFKVEHWLSKLDAEKLSKKENAFTDGSGKERKLASPYENYMSFLSDLKLKNHEYEECITTCDEALDTISRFHYDNDLWFKRKKALSMINLDQEEGFELLLNLTKGKKGDKWFIYSEIAQIYFDNNELEKCLDYCKKAIQAFGDEAFKINLLILTARCLFKLENMQDAELLAHYICGISLVHDLKEKQEFQRILTYFKIETSKIREPKKYLSEYRQKVLNRFGNKPKSKPIVKGQNLKGFVKKIHGNQKSGHIKSGQDFYFFGMRAVKSKNINEGDKVTFNLMDAKDRDGNPEQHATNITVIT